MKPIVLATALLPLLVIGCGNGDGGTCEILAGSYNGSLSDNVRGNGALGATLFQEECSIEGSIEFCFQDGCDSGQIDGFVDDSSFELTVFQPSVDCETRVEGTLSGNTISGSYFRDNCSIGGGGTFAASR